MKNKQANKTKKYNNKNNTSEPWENHIWIFCVYYSIYTYIHIRIIVENCICFKDYVCCLFKNTQKKKKALIYNWKAIPKSLYQPISKVNLEFLKFFTEIVF